MRVAVLVGIAWQLSLQLCSAQCYDSATFCSNSYANSPPGCSPDLSTSLPTIYNETCAPNDLILWRRGIEDGTSTESDPLIDYSFMFCQNSFSQCGYVPLQISQRSSTCGQVKDPTSGVIIGGGVDLGQETGASLSSLNVSSSTMDILSDYLGLIGSVAAEKVCNEPLNLEFDVAYNLSTKLMDKYANEIQIIYNEERGDGTTAFAVLPLGVRTVLTSIYWRLGYDAEHQDFWDAVFTNDFVNAAAELRSLNGCGLSTKLLRKEANIMEASLGCTKSSGGVDCVFLLDESGSVGSGNFELAKDWVVDFVESFASSISSSADSGARFGAATFSSSYGNDFFLNDYSYVTDYTNAIEAISYSGGGTSLGAALSAVGTNQFIEANGMRASDKGITRVLIVMTDGQSGDNVATGVATLSGLNLNIVAVGIAGYNIDQLRDITTDEYIYTLDTFTDLDQIIDGITTQTCYAPTQLDIDTADAVVDVIVGNGDTVNFEFGTSSANATENILLDITQKSGCVYVYVSYCVQYPSYYEHDVQFTSCAQKFKQIIVRPTSTECSSTSIKVTIEGRGSVCSTSTSQESNSTANSTATFDLDLGKCNSAAVGCVNGTNYDPELDVDEPYDVAEVVPTSEPTTEPTIEPTVDPTTDPTANPTADPTTDPTKDPTVDPTADPTIDPTIDPTMDPSVDPTADPTVEPTVEPTSDPTTSAPSLQPTTEPTTTTMDNESVGSRIGCVCQYFYYPLVFLFFIMY